MTGSMILMFAIPALLLGYGGVLLVRRWATQRGVIDVPNQRSSHTAPTPRGGGVVFFPVVLLGLGAHAMLAPATDVAATGAFLLLAGAVTLVSWLDDLRSVPFQWRLGVHVLAAVGAVLSFGHWHTIALPWAGPVHVGAWGAILTVVWIVGLTNAYNFMDGIDGIAGLQALVAGIAWAILAALGGWQTAGLIGILVAAASAGFLAHNWSPARIFMGDAGSAFLGFTFAVIPLVASSSDPWLPISAALIVWPFVADAAGTFIRRAIRGEEVWNAHKSHLYQRLVQRGWSHARVAILYGALASVGAALALWWWKGRA